VNALRGRSAEQPGEDAIRRPETAQAVSGRKRRQASAERILAAARQLLAEGGPVAKLSVDRIIAEAGVSRATFYACFPDKHAVVGRLAARALSWREQVPAEVLADPHGARAQVDELMRTIVAHWRVNRPVLAALIELAEHEPAMREPWRAAISQIADQTADQLQVRWADHPGRPPNIPAIATAFTWMFERCCHQLVTDDASADSVALAISEILWRTLTYSPPRTRS
jgi:AcrR family transcriptional regulator